MKLCSSSCDSKTTVDEKYKPVWSERHRDCAAAGGRGGGRRWYSRVQRSTMREEQERGREKLGHVEKSSSNDPKQEPDESMSASPLCQSLSSSLSFSSFSSLQYSVKLLYLLFYFPSLPLLRLHLSIATFFFFFYVLFHLLPLISSSITHPTTR